jgi:hypothetical protein
MKKSILPIVASGILFFSACTNENSSTVASFDDEQSNTSHSAGKEHQPENKDENHGQGLKEESKHVTKDTSHTNISVGTDSAGFETKQGTGASTDSNGIKVTSKKVKVDVKTRQ